MILFIPIFVLPLRNHFIDGFKGPEDTSLYPLHPLLSSLHPHILSHSLLVPLPFPFISAIHLHLLLTTLSLPPIAPLQYSFHQHSTYFSLSPSNSLIIPPLKLLSPSPPSPLPSPSAIHSTITQPSLIPIPLIYSTNTTHSRHSTSIPSFLPFPPPFTPP